MNPKQLIVSVGRGCDPEDHLEVADSLVCLIPGATYVAKDTVTFADRKLIIVV